MRIEGGIYSMYPPALLRLCKGDALAWLECPQAKDRPVLLLVVRATAPPHKEEAGQ